MLVEIATDPVKQMVRSCVQASVEKTIRLLQPKKPVYMNKNEDYKRHTVGEWTYGYPRIIFSDSNSGLKIGKFCSIAEGVIIMLGGEHRLDWITTYPFSALLDKARRFRGHSRAKGDVVIGNDVWIGRDVLILSGVTIGSGAVIGARSVVTKDIRPYAVVVGNPAREVRRRFADDVVDRLLAVAWWDWPQKQIEEAWPYLLSSNIEGFLVKYTTAGRIPNTC